VSDWKAFQLFQCSSLFFEANNPLYMHYNLLIINKLSIKERIVEYEKI
jgi:hypothetical protein